MVDERVKLPPLVAHFLWFVVGISGFFYIYSAGVRPTSVFWLVVKVLLGAMFCGFASYGLVCFIKDIKKGKTLKGTINEIKNTIKQAFYNERGSR